MTSNDYPNFKLLIISILACGSFPDAFKECRKKFIINALVYFSGIKGKINFLQLQPLSENVNKTLESMQESRESKFNFHGFHLTLIKENVCACIIAFDPGCIPKSVKKKKTCGLGAYRSGCVKAIGLESINNSPLACREFVREKWTVRLNNCKT
ncbi:MAG: hypothetical protein LBU89_02610 [Fibromonadaceae bacterium]|jgi:hypothetical protein|nr:hypothetical protein [Fibromonadaceae bacterium]